ESGEYKIEHFLLLGEQDSVLFLTPLKSSDKYGHLVVNPLPLDFAIAPDETTSMELEVIPYDGTGLDTYGYLGLTVGDNGYFSFQLQVIEEPQTPLFTYDLRIENIYGRIYLERKNIPYGTRKFNFRWAGSFYGDYPEATPFKITVSSGDYADKIVFEGGENSFSNGQHIRVVFSQPKKKLSHGGPHFVNSQEELEEFGNLGYTHIEGVLILKGDITDLSPINHLKVVNEFGVALNQPPN
ncbi:MAG: hypothetical protein MI784_08290, partial [Cytophagales bacterium]|nr:hypothetical protein [Cytophagales bacterium]